MRYFTWKHGLVSDILWVIVSGNLFLILTDPRPLETFPVVCYFTWTRVNLRYFVTCCSLTFYSVPCILSLIKTLNKHNKKYSVLFLEASHSVLVLQLVDQSLPIIILYPLRCSFKPRFFQIDPYTRWMFW